MTRLGKLVCFFSAPYERQIFLLRDIPIDVGAVNFYPSLEYNSLSVIAYGIDSEFGQADSESIAEFLARTGLPANVSLSALEELCCLINLLRCSPYASSYWTRRALKQKTEWALVRRMAQLALNQLNWQFECNSEDMLELLEYFGTRGNCA